MFKRVLLFLVTNILVILTISVVTSLLGLHNYLTAYGIDYTKLAIFCAIWGTAGAFISLLFSKQIAKISQGVNVIDPQQATGDERRLLDMIYGLAQRAGLRTMPEVGIYDAPELNAFATGPTKNDALVAVSSGLLTTMRREEVEGVLGHEISHVANGDMVTMTLIMGIVNAFSLFLSRILAYTISVAIARNGDREGGISTVTYSLLTILFDVLLTILGTIVVAAFSRWREYRADRGGANLAGKNNMIAALQRLKSSVEMDEKGVSAVAALKISHRPTFLELFSSHPPLEKRIERLKQES